MEVLYLKILLCVWHCKDGLIWHTFHKFVVQIEDLSQQAQMAAAEKFKTPDMSTVMGNPQSSVSQQPIPEESDEEVGDNLGHRRISSCH